MNLEQRIKQSILNWPLLYKNNDYESSKLLVLNHMFFVIGNGYSWNEDGTLTAQESMTKIVKSPDEDIWDSFFDTKLYCFNVKKLNNKLIKKLLNGRLYYVRKDSFNNKMVIFFSAKDGHEAGEIIKAAAKEPKLMVCGSRGSDCLGDKAEILLLDKLDAFEECSRYQRKPYELSKYSALVEMMHGKTAEGLVFTPQQEYIDAAIFAAEDALEYYNNKKRYCKDYNYPKDETTTVANKKRDTQRWNKYKQEQIKILNAFLKKFKRSK